MFGFERLDVLQKPIGFADLVYSATRYFPSQSFIERNQGFFSPVEFEKVYAAAEKIGKMLSGLRRSLGGDL